MIDTETIHSLLFEVNGQLFWRPRPISSFKTERLGKTWNTRFSGKRAGTVVIEHGNKYVKISIAGRAYYEHRLIWMLHKGECPETIDHIDGNGLNNIITNLRDGAVVNSRNIKIPSTNKSGVIGVHWCVARKKWVAQGQTLTARLPLGRYTSLLDAVAARRSWELKEGYDVRTDR